AHHPADIAPQKKPDSRPAFSWRMAKRQGAASCRDSSSVGASSGFASDAAGAGTGAGAAASFGATTADADSRAGFASPSAMMFVSTGRATSVAGMPGEAGFSGIGGSGGRLKAVATAAASGASVSTTRADSERSACTGVLRGPGAARGATGAGDAA